MSHLLSHGMTFDWNDQEIDFSAWPARAFGTYDYTTRDRLLRVVYSLQPAPDGVQIALVELEGWPRRAPIPGVAITRSKAMVTPPAGVVPQTVPDALLIVVMWAEAVLRLPAAPESGNQQWKF